MSAIGSWIYLYAENYEDAYKSGVVERSFKTARDRMNNQLNQMKKRREGLNIEEIQTKYNNIRQYFNGKDPGLSDEEKKIADAIKKTMSERFSNAYNDKTVNQATAKVMRIFNGEEIIMPKSEQSVKKMRKSTSGTYVSTFLRRIMNLNKDYNAMMANNNGQYSKEYMKKLSNSIKKIEKDLVDLVKVVEISGVDKDSKDNYLESISQDICNDVTKNIGFIRAGQDNYDKVTNLKTDINNLLLLVKSGDIARAAGQYFEEESALILQYLIAGAVSNGIDTLMNEINSYSKGSLGDEGIPAVVGSDGSTVGYDFNNNNFIKDFDKYLSEMKTSISEGGEEGDNFKITNKCSPDKVDVRIIQKVDAKEVKRNFSMKNYNPYYSKDIHLVSSTPLLYLLQNENVDNFANHYLNIVLPHYQNGDELKKDGTPGKELNIHGLYDKATKIVKEMVLIKSLTGAGTVKKGGLRPVADYLAVNDNSTGKVHFYAADELIADAIREELFSYKTQVKNGKGWETVDFTGLNKFVKSDEKKIFSSKAGISRIYQVLGELHRRKIQASIDIKPKLNKQKNSGA